MTEQLIPQQFVNEFFLGIVELKKHPQNIKVHEHPESRAHKMRPSIMSLSQEAQDIQALEEKPVSIPMPMPSVPIPETLHNLIAPPRVNLIQVPVPQIPRSNFLDFGRLNAIINDPNVTLIQCNGSNSPITINRKNKTEKTNTILSEREIQSIIHKFSLRSNSPITEPIFKAQINPFAITAVISPISWRFVIVRKS